MGIVNQKTVFILLALFLAASFSHAAVKDDLNNVLEALNEGDIEQGASVAADSLFGIADELNLVFWVSIFFGLVLIFFVVLKLSTELAKPKIDKEKIKKEKEEKEFRKMFKTRESSIDELKSKLTVEKKKK